MTGPTVDRALRELTAELAGATPSPAFRAGVHARLSDGQPTAWKVWTWGAAATALAAAALVTFSVSRPEGSRVIPASQTVHVAEAPRPAASAPPLASEVKTSRDRSGARRTPPAVTSSAASILVAAAGPDVTVVTNQPGLLKRLWSQVPQAVMMPADAPTNQMIMDIRPIEVPQLTVDLISVPPLTEPGKSGAAPTIRRVAADEATRSN